MPMERDQNESDAIGASNEWTFSNITMPYVTTFARKKTRRTHTCTAFYRLDSDDPVSVPAEIG